jgi:predicted heme/steroid binding protein
MAIQGFFTGDVKIRDLNGVLRAVNGIVEVASDAGTVTSVGLAVGSTGTDVNVANSPITSSGNITLNLPTASATNRGLLSSTDWAIFSAKQGTITLTTTGNNGSATLTSGTLNIPTYTLAGLGGISLTSLSASSPLLYNNTTGAFSIQVANGSQNGYLSSADWTTFNSKQSALTFSSPLVNTSGTISIPAATSSVNGYLTSTDWSTFNNKQNTLILTTTGSSGASTLVGATLNIPTYTLSGLGGVPTSRQLTINGTAYDLSADRSWSVGTVTSVSASITGNSLSISGSPIINSGTLAFSFLGNATQYVRGDGALATLPTNGGGGGASVSYYLNGSINQGTIGGVTYYEMNKTPIIGAGTDFTTSSNGYIASFLTDANDPALLNIPAGNFNFETYFEASSGGGSPTFYIELYKYDGTTFTLIASNSGSPKLINDGTNIEAYFSALAVPQTTLTLTDRLAIRIYVTTAGRTITLHTENNTLCQVITTFTTGLAALNGLTSQVQYLATGTSGTDFNISSLTDTHTFNLPTASATNRGALSSADWTTFNNKQAAGSYITALTGEATASGPGSASVTLSTSAVTGKLLTGLNLTGGGTIAATDSILQAFGKVQNQISGLAGGVTYQGTWNASTNTPTLTSSVGTKGYYYIVDVAGSTNLNGITDWKIGDWAIFNGSTWDKVDNTDAVSSVNGFTGAVSLTTSNIAEGTNLYYLDSRARLALSFTAGSGAYDNTTGVITIPTNTSQLTNGANFITLSSLSASSPLAYNSGTGAFSIQVATGSQNGYLSSTDWATFNGKQNALTLTTTGSSGSATLVGATLNVPTYTLSGLGGVPTSRQLTINGTAYDLSADRSWSVGTHTGSLTSGYIPKATGTTSLADSLVYDAGTAVLIGTTTASTSKFMVYSTTADNHYQAIGSAPSFRFADTITSPNYTGIIGLATASNNFIIGAAAGDMVLANNTTSSLGNFLFGTGTTERMRITPTGNVSINNTNNTYRFDVNGTVRFTGQLRLESTITDGTNTYTLPSATGTIALVGGSGVGTVTSVGLSSATSGVTIGSTPITTSGTITLAIATASGSQQGLLSSTDWTTFNNKQNALTNPVTGTGTTNYLPKFTGTSTIGNSLVFDNGTNVGIGTTSPDSKLHILDGAGNSLRIGFLSGTSNFNLYDAAIHTFRNNGGTTEYMRLNASGNLSIGNTNDTYKLDVTGTARFTKELYLNSASGSTGAQGFLFFNSGPNSASRNWRISNDQNAWGDFVIQSSSTQTGGITNTPFSIASTGAATLTASSLLNEGVAGMVIRQGGASGNNGLVVDVTNTPNAYIADFRQANSSLVRITGAGNVGIGTTSPARTLHVLGQTGIGTVLKLEGASGTTTYLQLAYNGATNSQSGYIGYDSSSNMSLFTNDTERMRITSAGELCVGRTTAYGAGFLVNVQGNIYASAAIVAGSSVTATGGFEIPNGQFYRARRSSGSLLTDMIGIPSGTDDVRILTTGDFNVINGSLSNILTVKNGGNVGIGTTSPVTFGTRNLDVNAGSGGSAYIVARANSNGGTVELAFDTDAGYLSTKSNHPLIIRTNDVERMRITSGGDVGVGLTAPLSKLHVNGTMQVGYVDASNTAMEFYWNGASSYGRIQTYSSSALSLNPLGNNVLIGTSTNGSSKLRVVGLPTSSSGLSSGDIWNDSGTLKIV